MTQHTNGFPAQAAAPPSLTLDQALQILDEAVVMSTRGRAALDVIRLYIDMSHEQATQLSILLTNARVEFDDRAELAPLVKEVLAAEIRPSRHTLEPRGGWVVWVARARAALGQAD